MLVNKADDVLLTIEKDPLLAHPLFSFLKEKGL